MSLWRLIPIALAVLGFWASEQKNRPVTLEEELDWIDEHESMFDGGDDEQG